MSIMVLRIQPKPKSNSPSHIQENFPADTHQDQVQQKQFTSIRKETRMKKKKDMKLKRNSQEVRKLENTIMRTVYIT